VLNAPDGTDFDVMKVTQKEALFCGMPFSGCRFSSGWFVGIGIYPTRLELLGGDAGGVVDYLRFESQMSQRWFWNWGDTTHFIYCERVRSGSIADDSPRL